MKKSIKYAGVAAATLLAVAPVAAPVLSSSVTTTVQAADATYTTDSDANDFLNQFANKQIDTHSAKTVASALFSTNYGTKLDLSAADFMSAYGSLVSNNALDGNTFTTGTTSKITSVQATADDTGDVLSLNDVKSYLNNGQAVTFTVKTSYNSDENTTATPSKTFDITFAATTTPATVTSMTAKYTTPISVEYNSASYRAQLQNSTDLTLTDQKGNDLLSNSDYVSGYALGNFFTTYDAAASATAATAGDTTDDIDNGNFVKADATYYQPITVTLTSGATSTDPDAKTALEDFVTGDTYETKTTVNGSALASGATTTNNGVVSKTAPTTITFVREIHVGSEAAAGWTTKDETGVVTTKTDKTYYTMKNDDDKTITNRALAANTSWKYDQVRTNANGDVQYRVSTHEWIPAESVTVNDDNDNGGTTTPDGALTVTNLDTKKVVNLATPGMTYFLYNKDGVMSDSRALAGGTSWLVDKTATDAAGNTYYGVSTNEFVKAGEGVSLAD